MEETVAKSMALGGANIVPLRRELALFMRLASAQARDITFAAVAVAASDSGRPSWIFVKLVFPLYPLFVVLYDIHLNVHCFDLHLPAPSGESYRERHSRPRKCLHTCCIIY
jgi:hypothetical protein